MELSAELIAEPAAGIAAEPAAELVAELAAVVSAYQAMPSAVALVDEVTADDLTATAQPVAWQTKIRTTP